MSLDGTEVMRATDRAFRDAFDRVIIIDSGGTAIQSVAVFGG